MNRKLAILLNWLDERRSRIDYPKFECRVRPVGNGRYGVDIRHLKVWLYRDRRQHWIAQGLDIGYAASAIDPEEARTRFARGLATSMVVNLEKFGNVDSVLRPAPPEVWLKWRKAVRGPNRSSPRRVVSEPDEVVSGMIAPTPKLEMAFYGSQA